VKERKQQNLRDPGDATVCLDLPELGSIPSASADFAAAKLSRGGGRIIALNGGNGGGETKDPLALATWQARYSLTAESYRSAVASILLSGQCSHRNVILITSPGPREGKTTTVSNIGIALAEMAQGETRQRVVLVDCDIRKPRLHKAFGIQEGPGLCDFLSGANTIEDCKVGSLIVDTGIPGLCVLTCGSANQRNPQAVHSPRFGQLVEHLRREFNFVLLDTPPMISFSDARLLARWADAVALVIRSGRTSKESAMLAKQQLRADGSPLLGTILTDWNPRSAATSDYGYNKKYLDSYRKYYGEESGE
jgi:receptor protein-tyrosine kinase